MPLKITPPIEKEFHLKKSDEELGNVDGATMVTIRQARQGDYERVNDLTSEFRRQYDGINIVSIQRISFDDIRRKQVYLTMVSCEIIGEDEKNPLWKFKNGRVVDENHFRSGWDSLPPVVADEIYQFVLEMNPLWDDRVPKPAPVQPEKSGEAAS